MSIRFVNVKVTGGLSRSTRWCLKTHRVEELEVRKTELTPLKGEGSWDFPGGPVVKTLSFHCKGQSAGAGKKDEHFYPSYLYATETNF